MEPSVTVVEARLREPGFYQTDTRVFYVSQQHGVFLLQAPGAPLILLQEGDLPEDASSTVSVDALRRDLAAVIDCYGGRLMTRAGRVGDRPRRCLTEET